MHSFMSASSDHDRNRPLVQLSHVDVLPSSADRRPAGQILQEDSKRTPSTVEKKPGWHRWHAVDEDCPSETLP
jgi:hypothetical protein